MNNRGKLHIVLFSFFFFVSGATALIYELLWTRMLGFFLGNTTHAITAMLIAFMAGLGLGSYLIAQILKKRQPGLWLYGVLEILIAAYAISIPEVLNLIESAYILLHQSHSWNLAFLTTIRFLLSMLAFLIPTTMMGATLPIMVLVLKKWQPRFSRSLGLLYGINTLGAMLGTMLAGWWLIPIIGLTTILKATAMVNATIGFIVILIDKCSLRKQRVEQDPANINISSNVSNDFQTNNKSIAPLLLTGMMLTGAAAMIIEIGWTRALILLLGGSTYAFATVLVVFLAGIGLGSLSIYFFRSDKFITLDIWLWLQIAIATSSTLFILVYPNLHLWNIKLINIFHNDFNLLLLIQFLLTTVILIMPTFCMGLSFPVATQLYRQKAKFKGASVGNAYAATTLGNVAGSAIGGLILLPFAGTLNTLKIAAFIYLMIGTGGLLLQPDKLLKTKLKTVAAVLVSLALIVFPGWSKNILNLGTAAYGFRLAHEPLNLHHRLHHDSFHYFKEGDNALIAVIQNGNNISLTVNGKADASTGLDMKEQLFLGYLPLLYNQAPEKEVLVVGLGSGVTSSVPLLFKEVEKVTTVEIAKEVVEAAYYFNSWNNNLLENNKHQTIIEDGRVFLKTTNDRFDIIISEPSNPWIAGIGNLFTDEYYKLCKSKLAPGGVVSQWLQAYKISLPDYLMIAKTFSNNFKYVHLWTSLDHDTLFVGSEDPLVFNQDRLNRLLKEEPITRVHLNDIFKSPTTNGLFSYYAMSENEIIKISEDADINYDYQPRLEFNAPRHLYNFDMVDIESTIKKNQINLTPPMHNFPIQHFNSGKLYYDMAQVYLNNNHFQKASILTENALELENQPEFRALRTLIQVCRLAADGKSGESKIRKSGFGIITELRKNPESPDLIRFATTYYKLTNDLYGLYSLLPEKAPRELLGADTIEALADASFRFRDYEGFLERIEWCMRERPLQTNYYRGKIAVALINDEKFSEAIELIQELIAASPLNSDFWYFLGYAQSQIGKNKEAVLSLKKAVNLAPTIPEHVRLLAQLEDNSGLKQKARDRLKDFLRIDPTNQMIQKALDEKK